MLIGGTGLLGFETAKLLARDNHEIISFALPPKPTHLEFPNQMELVFKNYLELSDNELLSYLKGCQGLIFAAGIDERVEGQFPIYNLYYKYNIEPLKRLLPLAKKAGITNVVIYGSYFSHFNKIWPELKLAKYHPYIKSRVEQEEVALSYVDKDFNISIIEIPYVFGVQKGREPVWTILVSEILKMKRKTYWTKGGTTMVTARQVAEATVGALLTNQGGNTYPLGYYNMTWKEMLNLFHKYLGFENRKIITVPNILYKLFARRIMKQNKKRGIETGLNLVEFAKLQSRYQYIDKNLAATKLGVTEDNIEEAIKESVILSKQALDSPKDNLTKMSYK